MVLEIGGKSPKILQTIKHVIHTICCSTFEPIYHSQLNNDFYTFIFFVVHICTPISEYPVPIFPNTVTLKIITVNMGSYEYQQNSDFSACRN